MLKFKPCFRSEHALAPAPSGFVHIDVCIFKPGLYVTTGAETAGLRPRQHVSVPASHASAGPGAVRAVHEDVARAKTAAVAHARRARICRPAEPVSVIYDSIPLIAACACWLAPDCVRHWHVCRPLACLLYARCPKEHIHARTHACA